MRKTATTRGLLLAAALIGASIRASGAEASTITGTVRNEGGAGLSIVDLDFIDACGGDNIFLSGDKTAADGTFSVVVPTGTYDVHFTPPSGSAVCAADLQGYVVGGNASLGTVTLHPGRLVSGTVQTPTFGPAAGVDLKFVNTVTGERVYLTKDVTNASGQYAARVPPGTWDIDIRPPSATSFTDAERLGLAVGGVDVSGLIDRLGTGFIISGDVRDKLGNKVKNVDVDVYDACTGRRLATAHDNTDSNGNYAVCVPAGTYTFNYDPPQCKALESARTPGFTVDRTKNIGTEQLKGAVLVSGVVRDGAGLLLLEAKIKFYDVTAAGAPRQATTHDHTDAAGVFSVYVPPGTYDINIEPPPGVSDLVEHLNSVQVAGTMSVGTVELSPGIAVGGQAVGPGNVPVANVNINAVDSVTRVAQRLAHDETDAAGNFTVVVAPGTYDFQYDPPACSGMAPTSQNFRVIGGPQTLPMVSLVAGLHILGSAVHGLALPAANVDLDIYPAGTQSKLYTPGDLTAADGTYDVLVPPGTYDIKYIPSSLTRLRPADKLNVAMSTSQTLPLTTLLDGWIVSGLVLDGSTLAPLDGVTVDFYVPGAGAPVWTTHHMTNATGGYSVCIDAGTWDILYTPAPGSLYAPVWRRGVTVTGDLSLTSQTLSSSVGVPSPDAGGRFGLSLSAPGSNPARRNLQLTLAAPNGEAELTCWDVAGRRVATLWHGSADAPVDVEWDFTGENGVSLASGVYYLRLADRAGAKVVRRVVWVH